MPLTGLLYYDCCLTFKDEVKLVKEKRFSLATVLYMVLRYGFLYLATTVIIQNVPVSESFQRRLTTPRYALSLWNLCASDEHVDHAKSCQKLAYSTMTIELLVYTCVAGTKSTLASHGPCEPHPRNSVYLTTHYGDVVTKLVYRSAYVSIGTCQSDDGSNGDILLHHPPTRIKADYIDVVSALWLRYNHHSLACRWLPRFNITQ